MRKQRGFTLIEILIVVVILGVLAGIVLPQFVNATNSSKSASVSSTAHTLRGAVQLYYYQHNDTLPPPGAGTAAGSFWFAMTQQTDANGNPYTVASTSGPFGPYMQSIPFNSTNQSTAVIDANVAPGSQTAAVCGWEYDYNGGVGNGVVHGTDADFKTVLP